jgi:hypothetical protein
VRDKINYFGIVYNRDYWLKSMDIYDTWKLYKKKMEEYILKFNEANKEGDFEQMKTAKDGIKNVYLKFI